MKRWKKTKLNFIEKYGIDAWKEKERERRIKFKEAKKEHINEYRRNYYERNKEKIKGQTTRGRYARDPSRGLDKLILDFRRGNIGYDDFVRRFNRAVIQSHALTDGRSREKLSE